MQTILGSGGAIGAPLAKELKKFTDNIRLVSRNPKKVNSTDELYPMDANDLSQLDKAIEGKLVFFDNVYMYDQSAIPHMTESTAINAPSKKGVVRQELHEMIMKEVDNGSLTALIARSADFYGPENKTSALNLMVLENLLKGKKAQAFGDVNKIHTYTYTPDAAMATALLGNTPDAYNQVWHVPTTSEKLTNAQWIQLIADELKVESKIQMVPVWLINILVG